MKCHPISLFIAVTAFVTSTVAQAAPLVEEFGQALGASPKGHADLQGKARLEAFQKTFFQLSLDFPILTDWVMQDAGPDAWQIVLPEKREQMMEKLFQSHGVNGSSSLKEYAKLCEKRRTERLSSALKEWSPFTFTEGVTVRNSFFAYTEGLSDARHERFFEPGARLSTLSFDDGSVYGTKKSILDDAHGMMRDVDLSFDKQKLLFAWKKSDRLDDYHIYEYDIVNGATKQLTFGLGRADYEPIYLPDGDIVFVSTRPEQSVPCYLTEISNLYRMDAEGRYVRRLAIDQVQTIYPQLMNNGRVSYTRWDYSDRGQTFPHPVFAMNPDGQAQRAFYGGNSWFPTSLLHMRPIPGSDKTMAVASGHHTGQNGKLVVIDVKEGRDEGKGLHLIAPKREHGYVAGQGRASKVVKDMWGQEGDQFRYPYPLSEEEFLISYQPNYGFHPHWYLKHKKGLKSSSHYGLYWMNADGERELLHRATDLGVQRMVSLKRKAETKLIPDTVDYEKDTGTYYVHDVYKGIGMKGIPRGEAKKLRVVEIDYRAAPVGAKFNSGEGGGSLNSTPMSIGNATWDVKRILGDADIHEDGSVLVEVPAMVSQYHQILNAKGQVIQTTRTWDTLRPGERKSCIGCHDKTNANFHPYKEEDTLAWKHGVQPLQPFYGKTRGFSFVKEIQPILDRSCVDCHDGSNKERMDLRGIPTDGKSLNKRQWTSSYLNLTGAKADKRNSFVTQHPEKGIVSWISQMSRPTELPPYFAGSAKSPLMKMLEDGHQGAKLSEEDMHKLYAWIDLLVPFSGDYREGHAWGKGEMQFYDYYENKRKAQHAEERQNIVDLLAASGAHPQDNKSTAAFTRASYRSVLKNIELSPNAQGRHQLERYPAAIIETLSLSSDAKNPMSVTLRDRKTNRVLHELRIEPGEIASTRFSENINTGNTYLECSDKQATITILNAVGVLFEELPGDDNYRRHSFAK